MSEAADDGVIAIRECLDGIPAQVMVFVAVTEDTVTHIRVSVDPIPETTHGRNTLAQILARIASNIAMGRSA